MIIHSDHDRFKPSQASEGQSPEWAARPFCSLCRGRWPQDRACALERERARPGESPADPPAPGLQRCVAARAAPKRAEKSDCSSTVVRGEIGRKEEAAGADAGAGGRGGGDGGRMGSGARDASRRSTLRSIRSQGWLTRPLCTYPCTYLCLKDQLARGSTSAPRSSRGSCRRPCSARRRGRPARTYRRRSTARRPPGP